MSTKEFLTIREASEWATQYLGRSVSQHNISYLINYAKVHTYDKKGRPTLSSNGGTWISVVELMQYYDRNQREKEWKEVLGDHINWNLSFDNIREAERTKHVHRLHQYKGKFIPQLVEYFLDGHVNDFKKEVFFHEGGTILDPFVGSGTTLVQCLELGLNSIGIDISEFNCMISEVKTQKYDLRRLCDALRKAAKLTRDYSESKLSSTRENDLDQLLSSFNHEYYPNPQFKFLLYHMREFESEIEKKINSLQFLNHEEELKVIEEILGRHAREQQILEKEVEDFTREKDISIPFIVNADNFSQLSNEFSNKYKEATLKDLFERKPQTPLDKQAKQATLDMHSADTFAGSPFLSQWFVERQRLEMQYYLAQIGNESDPRIQNLMRVILSRTIRSCRATTHSDLATLIKPQSEPYYCAKHFKICRPVTTIIGHLRRYTEDTIRRISEFSKLQKDVFCEVINADSRTVNVFDAVKQRNEKFFNILEREKIDGIFTSPPYVGQIDYHEQHAYAYELFGIDRKDYLEIGRQSKGSGRKAQTDYVKQISEVLVNVKKFLRKEAPVFIVANDQKKLYDTIAEKSGMRIENKFLRPVLDRTERDKQPYSETIFLMKSD